MVRAKQLKFEVCLFWHKYHPVRRVCETAQEEEKLAFITLCVINYYSNSCLVLSGDGLGAGIAFLTCLGACCHLVVLSLSRDVWQTNTVVSQPNAQIEGNLC